MKKRKINLIAAISLAATVLTNSLQAQTDNNSRFGIKAGLNVSNMFTTNVEEKNTILGFNGGLFLKIALTEYVAFQPEVLYTMKGSELKYNNSFVNGTAKFSLNYWEVPLLAVINLTRNVNLQGGIYVATLSNAKIKNEADVDLFNFESELNKDDFNTLDYGLVVGLGTDFNKISFGVRYEYGLQTVGKERTFDTQSYTFPDARNSTFQFYLGISIL